MKKRSGFVSNSSSSSFIIGLANTKDKPASFVFDTKDNNDMIPWQINYELISNVESSEKDRVYRLEIESFTGSTVSVKAKMFDNIKMLDGDSGPDSDSHFWTGDYMDYDIDLDEFDNSDRADYEEIQKLGGQVAFGAGRDG